MAKQKILMTGTMLTGSSLLSNALSVHSKMIILSDKVHFFRFIYGRYEPLNEKSVHKMLLHQRARLYHRFGVEVDVEEILANIRRRGFSYDAIYDECMSYYLKGTGKEIWGDDPTLQWREIPDFLKIFPGGKAIHVLRDPRAVLTSNKNITVTTNNGYLNAIFNCIDSLNYAARLKTSLSADSYFCIRYEDLVASPDVWMKKLCAFLEADFEPAMLQPEKWEGLLDDRLVTLGRSSFDGKTVTGFSPERAVRWKNKIERWELCFIEAIAGDLLARHGYEPTGSAFSPSDFATALAEVRKNDIVFNNFLHYLSTGEGSNKFPNDPTDYRNWGISTSKSMFKDTPMAKAYISEMTEIEQRFAGKESA